MNSFSSQNSFSGPATRSSGVYKANTNSRDHAPLFNSMLHIAKGEVDEVLTRSFVGGLLKSSSPFTVLWRITSGIINAFDTVFAARSSTHITKKGLIVIKPSVAHSNASAAVIFKRFVRRVIASLLDPCPCSVLSGDFTSNAVAVNGSLSCKASTTVNPLGEQRASFRGGPAPAVANTAPDMVGVFVLTSMTNNGQHAEAFAGKVGKVSFFSLVNLIASARLSVARRKLVAINDSIFTAVTNTAPFSPTAFTSGMKASNGKPSKYLSSNIFSNSHYLPQLRSAIIPRNSKWSYTKC